jgi:hypothetical protein
MSALQFLESPSGSLSIGLQTATELWRYVYEPDTPADESPRPYAHPVYSIDGDVLTNWRPNDHRWHHGLNFTLTSINGVNFWGGPSHRAADSYQWREDQGQQRHVNWLTRTPERLVEHLTWHPSADATEVMLEEERTLSTSLVAAGWSLEWRSRLRNPGSSDLTCHNYHSLGGLEGSHYTGLQFRGARGLLDEHGDDAIRLVGEHGATESEALHGHAANWLEWHGQADGTLRRTKLRFESLDGPIPWFIRRENPLVAFPPHREAAWVIAAGETVELNHRLTFTRS